MGRAPCCAKVGLNRGPWTREEDLKLTEYITIHGEGCWRTLPKSAGLLRCGKSCRLRWINYLRPDLKRGNISEDEDQLIITLHTLLGNRWSLIAGRLPGRTDNEIKNYWNTHLKKFKLRSMGIDPDTHRPGLTKQQKLQHAQEQQQQLLQQASIEVHGDESNMISPLDQRSPPLADQRSFNSATQLPHPMIHRSTTCSARLKPKPLLSFSQTASETLTGATAMSTEYDENYQKSVALVESFLRDSVMYTDHSQITLPQLKEHNCDASESLPASRSMGTNFSMMDLKFGQAGDSLSMMNSPCSPVSILQQCCSVGCPDRECSHLLSDFSNSCGYSDLDVEIDQKRQPTGVFGESPSITSESTASSESMQVDRGMSTPSSCETGVTAGTGWGAHVQLPVRNDSHTMQQLSTFLLGSGSTCMDVAGCSDDKRINYQLQDSVSADHSSSTNGANLSKMTSNCSSVDDAVSIWDMEILQPLTEDDDMSPLDPTSITSMSMNDTMAGCSSMWEAEYGSSSADLPLPMLTF